MKLIFPLKKIIVVAFFLTLSFIGYAQNYQVQIQNRFAYEQVKNKWLISDIQEWQISDQYFDKSTGITHSYVQQKINNILVFNAISICAHKGDEMVYFKSGLVDHLQNKVNASVPKLLPLQALEKALVHLQITKASTPQFKYEELKNNLFVYELNEIASSPVKVSLVYLPIHNEVKLAWNISIELNNQPHWWNIRVDALTGEFIDENDYTASCNFHTENDDLNCDDLLVDNPNPTPPPPTVTIPEYRVFPFPVEAPSFGGRSLLIDPASVMASPFGWHDINGVSGEEFNITKGNNVFAYEDANNDNIAGYSPNGGVNLEFDYPFSSAVNPIVNQDATLTNLFYSCNTIHDYLYAFGFDEVAGNFQSNNYGMSGGANDAVLAEGFDGGGLNNANFSTPPDGSAGRMQMYLWSGNAAPCTNLSISATSFSGSMTAGVAAFTAVTSVTANLVLVNDGVGIPTDGCTAIVNNVLGKIALIDRGICGFIDKAIAAQNAGAVGLIIANNVPGDIATMTGSGTITIPVVSVSFADGNILKTQLNLGLVNASISTCTVVAVDGALDNGIVAHEYGHGLSNRLTGGPSQSSCLTNAEQGGEGWSDWLALMMTIEPGDNGANARGIATYAKDQATNGAGIRRYPYSTNMSINPQTYGSLATSTSVHQRGEIWCDVLWDMTWKFIDSFGFSQNPILSTAGNNIAMKLVIEGMKLQPCNPGYLDARDAILLADALLYNNAHRCLIWQAFAGRGMGFNASQGSANLVGDEVESFLMPPFCLPATQVPIAAFSSDSITIGCGVALHFTDQSLNAFDWHWNFGDLTTSNLQNPTHTFTSPGVYTVKLIVSNPLGIDSITHTITVNPAFSVSVNASPTSICGGTSVNMNAVATGSNNKSYLVNSIPYSPISFTGNSVSLNDDQVSGANPIGFPFIFYGQSYTSFYICSNGFITFSSGAPASVVYGPPIPSSPLPNNLIALAWNDLNPLNAGSQIKYTTIGVAPNRKLIVDYNTSHFLSTSLPYQVQAILYEGSNEIEIHSTIISDASSFDGGATTTQGIENQDGSAAITISARNSSFFTANNDAYRFTPTIPYSYTWLPGNLSGSTQTVNPLLTTSYTVSVTDGTACSVNYNLPVITVNPCPINLNLKLFIEGYYNGGGSMQPVLYNEGVSLNQTLCDSITVELRSAIAPYNLAASSSALLQVNGQANCPFLILSGQYYIVVKHRNGLQTWSANPIAITTGVSGIVNYDFTISLNQAYGQNMKEVDTGVWAIYSGDIISDENIDLIDYQALETSIYNFGFGYIATDINGDGNVDLLDTSTVEENINSFIFSSHP